MSRTRLKILQKIAINEKKLDKQVIKVINGLKNNNLSNDVVIKYNELIDRKQKLNNPNR